MKVSLLLFNLVLMDMKL